MEYNSSGPATRGFEPIPTQHSGYGGDSHLDDATMSAHGI